MCDFETTVYDKQDRTEVWAAACVKFNTEDVKIFHSISEQYEYFCETKENIIAYYHNLKFDGEFWMYFLIHDLGYTQSYYQENKDDISTLHFNAIKDMKNDTFTYLISSMGQWYKIVIKHDDKIIELRDSLKLLPFSVDRIGQSFGTKHKKLSMDYTGFRYAGCPITDEEKQYIANDVLVVKEALEIMFKEGHNSMTIGACCLKEYKVSLGSDVYANVFPNMYDIELDENIYGYPNAGLWIKSGYRGGWCYVVKGKENKVFKNGTTADVNSLYPSMMSEESGNKYPIGYPTFWSGNYIPDEALGNNKYFYVRIRTRFYVKKNYLPFIQIKKMLIYKAREMLETSDVFNSKDGQYYRSYISGMTGEEIQAIPTITMSMTDYYLFLEHYDTEDFEILDGCYFQSMSGIFEDYISKYKKIKLESKGAQRELAKLFLNNLYGKMATSTRSDFKVSQILKDEDVVSYYTIVQDEKTPGYIPVGAAITSYARNFTIRASQQNYYGPDSPGFIYADTDSMHLDLEPDNIVGIKEDSKAFCCWKLEACWDEAIFVRPKTYIEHVTHENRQPIDTPYYNIKCAGMTSKSKELLNMNLEGIIPQGEERNNYKENELDFLEHKRTLTDFKPGLYVPGKLLPKRIPGGCLLVETPFQIR